MKIKYTKVSSYYSLTAKEQKIVAEEFIRIQKEESVINIKSAVNRARNPKNPLNKYLEWDDTVAAECHRQWQMRCLIASVYIVNADDPKAEPVRAFVNCSPSEDEPEFMGDRGYVFTPSIGTRQSYQNQVLEYAKNQLVSWRKRFGGYKEFFDVVRAIDSLK